MEASLSKGVFSKEKTASKPVAPSQSLEKNIKDIITKQTEVPILAEKLGVKEFFKEVASELPNRAHLRESENLKESLGEIENTILDKLQEEGKPETKEMVGEYFDNLVKEMGLETEGNIFKKIERIIGAIRVMQVQMKYGEKSRMKKQNKLLKKIFKNVSKPKGN